MTFKDPYIELEAVAQLHYGQWSHETERTTLGELRALSGSNPIRVSDNARGPLGRLWNPEAYDSEWPVLIVGGVFVEDTFVPRFDMHFKWARSPAQVAYEHVENIDWMQRAPRNGAGCQAYRRAIFIESAGYPQFVAFDLSFEARILQYMPTLCERSGHNWKDLGSLSTPQTLLDGAIAACTFCGSILIGEGWHEAGWERRWIHEPTFESLRWAALQQPLRVDLPEDSSEGRPHGQRFAQWLRNRGHHAETRAWQARAYVHMLHHRDIDHRVSSLAASTLDSLWQSFSLEASISHKTSNWRGLI
ncbi:hypothetical protein [Thioalkalivibrio sp. ALE11]|uniref:hypothetical protein n=1 Tax=Thioalkalivibrio sp. ALE11 TaxID=1265494 RepID=UPI0012DF61FC|nr:hypothetical protein [Thioalkalivibrio sp. ALE11]